MYADPSRPEVGTGFETERKDNFKNMADYLANVTFGEVHREPWLGVEEIIG